jgi:hypothetical protein
MDAKISIFLLGLVTGVSLSHFLQRGPKKTLTAAQFLAVQQVLFRNYGPIVGGLEVAALISTLITAFAGWGKPLVRVGVLLALACVLVMILIWAVWINPINMTAYGPPLLMRSPYADTILRRIP